MKIEITQERYDQLLATEKRVHGFITAIEDAANEGMTEENEDEFLGNPDFDSEMIADLAMKHFNLYGMF